MLDRHTIIKVRRKQKKLLMYLEYFFSHSQLNFLNYKL